MRALILFGLLSFVAPAALAAAPTCYGDADCRACRTCRYCGHCAGGGGTCGVCAPPPPVVHAKPKPKAKRAAVVHRKQTTKKHVRAGSARK